MLFGSMSFAYAPTLELHVRFNDKPYTITKEEKKRKAFEHRQGEIQAKKRKKTMQIKSEAVYSISFHYESEIQGKL